MNNKKDCKNCVHAEKQYNARKSERYIECFRWEAKYWNVDLERTVGECGVEGKHFEEVNNGKNNSQFQK